MGDNKGSVDDPIQSDEVVVDTSDNNNATDEGTEDQFEFLGSSVTSPASINIAEIKSRYRISRETYKGSLNLNEDYISEDSDEEEFYNTQKTNKVDQKRKQTLDDILGEPYSENKNNDSNHLHHDYGDVEEEEGGDNPLEADEARSHWNLASYYPPAVAEYFYFIIG